MCKIDKNGNFVFRVVRNREVSGSADFGGALSGRKTESGKEYGSGPAYTRVRTLPLRTGILSGSHGDDRNHR